MARPSFQVSNCDDDNFVRRDRVYDLIGKSLHQHTACSVVGRRRTNFWLHLNEGCWMNDGIKEFGTQSRALLLVPADGSGEFFAGGFEVSEYPSHLRRISVAIRCFALSHDSSVSVPASRALTRRWISLSQAVAAFGSAG